MTNDRFAALGFQNRRRTQGLLGPLMWVGGLIAAGAALTIGAVLAVFTAAAVAVIALFASVLVFLMGVAMRARRRVTVKARRSDDILEAQKVGDTWVTYGWERPHH